MQSRLQLGVTFVLIQQIRLAHALAESAFPIAVPADELPKFAALRERFDLHLEAAGPSDVDVAPFVAMSHEAPRTAIGGLARPLIFPLAIAQGCRTLWQADRPYRYSFAGLLTDERRRILEDWSERRRAGAGRVFAASSGLGRLLRRQLVRWRGHDRMRRIGDVTVWSSERGRRFPTKAWDEEYHRLLAGSQFVLCPSGDYRWSYRFFEAVLCGAIPVIEEPVPLYEGFRYRTMAEGGEPTWLAADAEHNYRLCVERIVLPGPALNAELARIAGSAGLVPASGERARTARPRS